MERRKDVKTEFFVRCRRTYVLKNTTLILICVVVVLLVKDYFSWIVGIHFFIAKIYDF